MVKKTNNSPQLSPNKLAFLVGILGKVKPKKVLEIGKANGGIISIILDTLNKQGQYTRLYSVELTK